MMGTEGLEAGQRSRRSGREKEAEGRREEMGISG